MQDFQLTLAALMRRADTLHPARPIVVRDGGGYRLETDYASVLSRARRLSVSLAELGVARGDTVATLCWNTAAHLEAYFGVTAMGGVVHTVNPRLHVDELAYIVRSGGAKVVVVDDTLLALLESFLERTSLEHVIVASTGPGRAGAHLDYEELVGAGDESRYRELDLHEDSGALLCFTSGTTGQPKGVLYSHRALVLKSLVESHGDAFDIRRDDTVLVVVPMTHIAAWCLPFVAALTGAAQVLVGSRFDDGSVLDALRDEGVTFAAGVPTIWLGVMQRLREQGGVEALATVRRIVSGGSAVPPSLIAWYREHDVELASAWGMTESVALGTIDYNIDGAPPREPNQGFPIPLMEVRARGEEGLVERDGQSVGELEIRGPFVIDAYLHDEGADRFTDDGWLMTGDIVALHADGSMEIKDRSKDLIKSGGEWISSIALENALVAHPAVLEAAVIAAQHPRWQERPLALIVPCPGGDPDADTLRDFIAPAFAKWWLPDEFRTVDELPRTSTGKVDKAALRAAHRFTAVDPRPRLDSNQRPAD